MASNEDTPVVPEASTSQHIYSNFPPSLLRAAGKDCHDPPPPGYAYMSLQPAIKKTITTVETYETITFKPILLPSLREPQMLDEGDASRHYLPYQSYPASSSLSTRRDPHYRYDPKIYPLARARAPSLMGTKFKMPLGQSEGDLHVDYEHLQQLYTLSPPLQSVSASRTHKRKKTNKSYALKLQQSPNNVAGRAPLQSSSTQRNMPIVIPRSTRLSSPINVSTTSFTANQMPSPVASPILKPWSDLPSNDYAPHSPPMTTADENSRPPSLHLDLEGGSNSLEALDDADEEGRSGSVSVREEPGNLVSLDLGSGLELSTLMSLPSLVEHFSALPNNLQSHVLFNLLKRSPIPVLQLVNSVITPALKRDFIADLPAEMAVLVLTFVDGPSLGLATMVSKKWHKIIDGNGRIWKRRMTVEGLWVGDGSEEREAVAVETGAKFLSKDELFLKRWKEGLWDPDFDGRLAGRSAAKKLEAARRSTPKNIFAETEQEDIALDEMTVTAHNKTINISRTLRKSNDPAAHYVHPYKVIYRNRYLSRQNWTFKEPRRMSFQGNGNNVVTALQFNKHRIIAASDDHSINVYSMTRLGLIAQLDGHDGGVWALAYIGDVLVSGSTDRTVRVWDVARNRTTHIFIGHTSTVRCLQIIEPQNVNPDADGPPVWEPPYPLIVTGSRDSTLRVWKLPMPGVDRDYLPFVPVASPDTQSNGDYIADNPFHVRVLAGHKNAVRALSGAGRIVVSGSYDNTIRVWDILNGDCLQILRGHSEKVYSVVYDGKRAQCASGSMDGTVKLWSTATGECLRSLDGHTSLVGLLGLSKNHLVSAAADSTLRVWDALSGKMRHILAAHSGAITCFQHDDYKVVSGSDGTLKMWDIRTGQYIRDLLVQLTGVWQVGFDERFCVAAVQRNGLSEFDILDFGRPGASHSAAGADDVLSTPDYSFSWNRMRFRSEEPNERYSNVEGPDERTRDPLAGAGDASGSNHLQFPTLTTRFQRPPPNSPLQHRSLPASSRRLQFAAAAETPIAASSDHEAN